MQNDMGNLWTNLGRQHADLRNQNPDDHVFVPPKVSAEDLVRAVLVTKQDDFAGRYKPFRVGVYSHRQYDVILGSDSPTWRITKKALHNSLKMYETLLPDPPALISSNNLHLLTQRHEAPEKRPSTALHSICSQLGTS